MLTKKIMVTEFFQKRGWIEFWLEVRICSSFSRATSNIAN